MIRTNIVIAAGLFAATLPAIPAQAAGVGRTFLSAAGSDSNNCANVLTPCRHFATAFAATAQDGEIYVLDPANYGSLTITHGVSIEGHGWASIAPVVNNPAITITANTGDNINIIGVVMDGTRVADSTGILFNGGGSLNVQDSVIRNFEQVGVKFVPNSSTLSQLFVSNTLVSDNGSDGIEIIPSGSGPMNGILDHVKIQNNGIDGLTIWSNTGQTINITVSDSVSANNASNGIVSQFNGGVASVTVRNSTIANNTNTGLMMASGVGGCVGVAGAIIRVSRSTITGNGTGWVNATCSGVLSYGDNIIDGNGSVNTEPPNPPVYH